MNFMMNMAAKYMIVPKYMVAASIGNNAYNWITSNAQPIVLGFIIISGVIIIAKKEVTKIVVWLLLSILALVMVFNTQGFADLLQSIGNTILGI